MTEAEWLACDDPSKLIGWLFFEEWVTDRKLRLFSAACCEAVTSLIKEDRVLDSLRLARAFAEGQVEADELLRDVRGLSLRGNPKMKERIAGFSDAERAARAAFLWSTHVPDTPEEQARAPAFFDGRLRIPFPLEVAGWVYEAVWHQSRGERASLLAERQRQIHLLRDIFGNPFRRVAFDSAWRTSTVAALAAGMYESRDFSPMPILADALQDAGRDSADILDHCRDPHAAHVRGCWVVDLVLGKQ